MSLRGSRRVHIAPQGYETERVYGPVIENDADMVVLLVSRQNTDKGKECRRKIIGELERESVERSVHECDFFDFDSTLWAILEIIERYNQDEIFINLSTGSKITAMGGMLACMATGATPYYAEVEKYPGKTVSIGYKGTKSLPAYPVALPDEQYIEILQYIGDHDGPSKKELIEVAKDFQLLSKYTRQQERNNYEPLNEEILNPLLRRKLIIERSVGTEKRVMLTENGEDLLKLAPYLLD